MYQVNLIKNLFILLLFIEDNLARPLTEIEISEDYDDETEEFYQPKNLEAVGSTQTSISLQWEMDVDLELDLDINYRIHYMHDEKFPDVKTIRQSEPQYTLKGLEPYTRYEIWVESIVNETQSLASDPIYAVTDVKEPSSPTIVNLTCYDTGMLYLEWTRPEEYHQSIDYYKIYYRPLAASVFEDVTIETSSSEIYQRVTPYVNLNTVPNCNTNHNDYSNSLCWTTCGATCTT